MHLQLETNKFDTEDEQTTTVLTKAQYDNCLGSPRYRICHETMETHLGFSSCLATLKFHHTISALKVCDTEKVVLPNPERAQNLGYGIWLLISASSDYTLSEIGTDENGRHINVPHKGCNICLITLNVDIQCSVTTLRFELIYKVVSTFQQPELMLNYQIHLPIYLIQCLTYMNFRNMTLPPKQISIY